MDWILKKLIEDYMDLSCDYCHEIKQFTDCNGKFTKCLEKATWLAHGMRKKGWAKLARTFPEHPNVPS